MKCRRINPENGMVVWFGVKDVKSASGFYADEDKICGAPYRKGDINMDEIVVYDSSYAKPTFQNDSNKHDNYADGSEGVANSLRQRLSVLKHELWYDYENGMPLPDKVKSKAIIDAYVIKTILSHPDVIGISGFESEKDGHSYSCYAVINTAYGKIELGI